MEQPILPKWLEKQNQSFSAPPRRRWRRRNYLEKTLLHIQQIMLEDTESFRLQNRSFFLQQMTPAVKMIGIFLLLLSVIFTRDLTFLVFINCVVLAVACWSGMRAFNFLLRIWLPTFLFVVLPLLPGTINWITPGEALYTIYQHRQWHFLYWNLPPDLFITKQGVKALLFVLLRAAASLGLTTLLIKTTRWSLLTQTLARLGVPTMVVMVLDLTYRYIYVFLLLMTDYFLGRKSRLVGVETQHTKISWIGSTVSTFLRLTGEYGRDINDAMRSRGYAGTYEAAGAIKLHTSDCCFFMIILLLCYCAYGGFFHVYISCI